MPEIKNTFTQGKMNKDLDERLVPKGQYIDAMNVEVTTSEDSDVGTVQNIYGNVSIVGNNLVPPSSVCVGSVVDDATDSLYWLTATDRINASSMRNGTGITKTANVIFKHNKDIFPLVYPVFVDIHQVIMGGEIVTQSISNKYIFVPTSENIRVGMKVRVIEGSAVHNMGVVTWVGPNPYGTEDLIVTSISQNLASADAVEFTAEVTGWDTDTLITGINIIDDMLFWTDNETEPKKINIPRSIEGTYLYNNIPEMKHTHLFTNHNDEGPIEESHITVIKPKPTTRINLEMKVNEFVNTGTYGWVDWNGRNGINNAPLAKPGDTITLAQAHTLDTVSFDGTKKFDYNSGDVILLKWSSSVSTSDFPINKYEVKAKLIQITNNDFTSSNTGLKLLILDVNHENYPGTNTTSFSPDAWALQKQSSDESLFELKFPRFSYRWKFEDGEYSTFAPWSNVGFLPGNFQWLPKEGFNLGMKNHLKELVLFDFISPNTPKDVVQIDLLYKESDSPNVYIIDSLKPDDPPPISGTGTLVNPWNSDGSQGAVSSSNEAQLPKGKYPITSETIFATVSPNQTLRNWDAVPRKALAQEIIGNRLTYANYVKNFDLSPGGNWKFKQDLTVSFKSYNVGKWENKSVKTIRDYQVGIAYIDEYGRETPVFTNNDSVVSIPKLFSSKSNILYSKINHLAPAHADAYKFYIKENSRKYYNLVMDRWYDAEDGDIWLSFNSHDRNKVDEETFLYLKRGHDGDIVEDNYKYKILSIKNEAPEFIRNVRKQFGIKPHDPTDVATWNLGAINSLWWPSGDKIFTSTTAYPHVGKKNFLISKNIVDNTSWANMEYLGVPQGKKFRVRFLKYPSTVTGEHRDNGTFSFDESPEKTSAWYKIDKILSAGGSDYMVNLNKELGNDCLFVTDPTSGFITSYIALEIAEEEAENLPEFDGRFFVKVLRDKAVNENIINTVSTTLITSQPLFYFNQPTFTGTTGAAWSDPNSVGLKLYKDEQDGSMSPTDDTDYNNVKDTWDSYFGNGTELVAGETDGPRWFIDELKYAGQMVGDYNYFWGNTQVAPWQESDLTPGAGQGINTTNKTIDISFSGHTHNVAYQFPNGYVDPATGALQSGSDDYALSLSWSEGWFGGNVSFWPGYNPTWATSPHTSSENFVDSIYVGAAFKFSEDTENVVYKITAIDVFTRWNYLDEDLWYKGTIYANGQGVGPITTGYRYTDPAYARGFDGDTQNSSGTYPNIMHNLQSRESTASNRRITYRLHLNKPIEAPNYVPTSDCSHNTAGCDIEFVDADFLDVIEKTSSTPAIWETEPKEESDLDIYYEASQFYPKVLSPYNISNIFSIGDRIELTDTTGTWGTANLDPVTGKDVEIKSFNAWGSGYINITNVNGSGSFTFPLTQLIRIHDKDSANYIELTANLFSSAGNDATIVVEANTHKWGRTLDWSNVYSFGNGVESDTIRDDFNQVEIGNGVTASTTVGWQYEEERLKSGLIFSGIYNAKTGLNDLNQFIEAENITKDVNPSYGSIQKLHARDSDLVVFCEDKVLKILSNKDALYNADENPNLISAENVLGQTLPFIGDYGISKNPESFARENFRSYFTDKKRGAVLRLSRDGITPISDNGMKDWFRDNLKDDTNQRIHGSYDNHKSHYNASPEGRHKTVVFNEASKGWVSFKSFVPESGESMNNDYFTFKDGKIYKHHVGPINSFYGQPVVDSTLSFVFNEAPSVVKSFTTINYEGTQSRIVQNEEDLEYTNLNAKRGWYVSDIQTDKQEGRVNDFVEKEGKWFNYITGPSTDIGNIDPSEFSFQGISSIEVDSVLISDTLHFGCQDELNPDHPNYNDSVNINTGLCPNDEVITSNI